MHIETDNEISLGDVLELFKEGWRWLAGGMVAGALGAAGFVLVIPVQYEATAVVQPASVGMSANTTKGVEVEPVLQTLERLKLPTFYTDELLQSCQAASQLGLAASVKATQVKGNSLIQVSYRASSAANAEACVNAVVSHLTKSQETIAEPVIKILEEQLVLTRKQLTQAEGFQGQLEKRAVSSADDASLLMLTALSKGEEIARLQKLLIDQKVQLSAPLTQPMQFLVPIYAPERAVAPKKLPILVGGLFGGLVLGGLMFFVRRTWLGRKTA